MDQTASEEANNKQQDGECKIIQERQVFCMYEAVHVISPLGHDYVQRFMFETMSLSKNKTLRPMIRCILYDIAPGSMLF
jgi:hypothetical protein